MSGLFDLPAYSPGDSWDEWYAEHGEELRTNDRLNKIANAGRHDGWLWAALGKPHPVEPFPNHWRAQMLQDVHDHVPAIMERIYDELLRAQAIREQDALSKDVALVRT